jgi:hypothetical protein
MAAVKVERRVYSISPPQLFGVCVTALGQLRATIERHDVEQGTIVAAFGEGSLGPISELALALRPLGHGQTVLAATWRARKRGGDRRLLAVFLEAVAALVGSQSGNDAG